MTRIALVVISDGRVADFGGGDYLAETLASLDKNTTIDWSAKILVDDSGLFLVRKHLHETYPDFTIKSHKRRLGAAAAVRTGWAAAMSTDCDYVFHLEQDFTFNVPPPIDEMVALLDTHRELAHVVLKRDPYGPDEEAVGDFMRVAEHAHRYIDRDGYVEWDFMFSMNPSLIRRAVIDGSWFPGEADFAQQLRDRGYRFAFWGQKADPPLVTHIGELRAFRSRL